MSEIKHKEIQYNYVFIALYSLYILFTLLVFISSDYGNENVGLAVSFLVTFLLLSYFVYMLGRIKISLTETTLHVEMGFGFSKHCFKVESINKGSIKIESLPWWFGFGHKQVNGNRTFFRIGFGNLISFVYQGEKYFISTRNPKEFFEELAS